MSAWGQNGHGHDEPLDDATVEALLAGDYDGDDERLLAVGRLFEQVRSVADRPPPPPSSSLAPLLTEPAAGGDGGDGGDVPAPGSLRHRSAGAWLRSSLGHPAAVAAAVAGVLLAGVVAAGSARILPGPTQNVVARIVRTVTPFDFPEERERAAADSRAPTAQPPAPAGGDPAGAGDDGGQRPGPEPRVGEGPPAAGPAAEGGERPGVAAAAPPPSTAAVPGAAPAVVEPGGTSSDAPARSSRPPATPGNDFSADLAGATGIETAGDADGRGRAVLEVNPGRDELCLTLVVSGVARVTSVHLHTGPGGAPGPAVAVFTEPTDARTCVTVGDDLIRRLRRGPGNHSVDVHTTEFPSGALRGQLSR